MKIVREQREENNSLLRVTVGEEDYGQAVEKELREYKRKANIPGFRPGMVPMGLVKKMYGKGVLAEQSYRKASNAALRSAAVPTRLRRKSASSRRGTTSATLWSGSPSRSSLPTTKSCWTSSRTLTTAWMPTWMPGSKTPCLSEEDQTPM